MKLDQPRVALFATCLVELFRPAVGFAAAELIERTGARLSVPKGQTCCGQPNFNAGDRQGAARVAQLVISAFEEFDRVVVPSASCAGMLKTHMPTLFDTGSSWRRRAEALAAKICELTTFLAEHEIEIGKTDGAPLAHHHSCSALRETASAGDADALLAALPEGRRCTLKDPRACCGFGGTFAVDYEAVSVAIADKKLEDFVASGAREVTSADLGCLLHLATRAKRRGLELEFRHVAELLAPQGAEPIR